MSKYGLHNWKWDHVVGFFSKATDRRFFPLTNGVIVSIPDDVAISFRIHECVSEQDLISTLAAIVSAQQSVLPFRDRMKP